MASASVTILRATTANELRNIADQADAQCIVSMSIAGAKALRFGNQTQRAALETQINANIGGSAQLLAECEDAVAAQASVDAFVHAGNGVWSSVGAPQPAAAAPMAMAAPASKGVRANPKKAAAKKAPVRKVATKKSPAKKAAGKVAPIAPKKLAKVSAPRKMATKKKTTAKKVTKKR